MRVSVERALTVVLVLNATFLVLELVVGLWTGSLALLSDATHMVADVAALALARFAAHVARRPPTGRHTFGMARAEVLGAFVNAVVLTLACGAIFFEAGERLVFGAPPMHAEPVLWVGLAGLVINVVSALLLLRAGTLEHDDHDHDHDHAHGHAHAHGHGGSTNLNVRAAMLHMSADALGSLGAILAAASVLLWDWHAADAVASLLIGAMVLAGVWSVLRDAALVLMQAAPTHPSPNVLAEALACAPGVRSVHDVHVWTLGSDRVVLTAHVVHAVDASPHAVLVAAEAAAREVHPHLHTTLQLEAERAAPCPAAHCTGGVEVTAPRSAPHPAPHHGH
jgi:cobalt-zinc-cadmium efflux system protein